MSGLFIIKEDKSIQTDFLYDASGSQRNSSNVSFQPQPSQKQKPGKSDNGVSFQPQPSQQKPGKSDNGDKGKKVLKEVGLFALKTAAISTAVLGGVALAVPAIGFTAGGVAAGSLAAAYQSAFLGGTIASGSAFATLQSIGAAGLALSTQAGIVGASAAASAAHSVAKVVKEKNDPDSKNQDKEGDDTVSEENANILSQNNIVNDSSKRSVSTQTQD